MQKPKYKNGKYFLPLFYHPLPRVLKYEKLLNYFNYLETHNTILDYGSGSQPYKNLLEGLFKVYISADYEPSNLVHGNRPDIFINSEQSISLPDGNVDCVLLTEVLEHIPYPNKALKEINRLLCDNGCLIGSVPFFQNEHEVPFDFYRYTYYGLKKLFEDNGFEIVKIEYIGGMFSVLIVLISKFLGLGLKGLNKIHFRYIALLLLFFFKIPEYLYLFCFKKNFWRIKFNRFSTLPLGYTFYLKKKPSN